jgi:hypothetical protein
MTARLQVDQLFRLGCPAAAAGLLEAGRKCHRAAIRIGGRAMTGEERTRVSATSADDGPTSDKAKRKTGSK